MKQRLGLVVLVCAVSGVLSAFPFGDTFWIAPGFWFGLATALAFQRERPMPLVRNVLWVVCSCAAWYVALQIFVRLAVSTVHFSLSGSEPDSGLGLSAWLVAGPVGAALLAAAHAGIYGRVSGRSAVLTVVAGGVLGLVMWGFALIVGLFGFIVWQCGVGAALMASRTEPVIGAEAGP